MNKKPMIIVGIIFALIIIALIAYLVLSLTTDIFKPTNEIFQRYFKENIEVINHFTELSKEEEYLNTLKQSNYRDNAKMELKYTNNQGNIEKFNLTSDGITNNSNHNSYRTINMKYGEDYNIMNVEYLQENQKYGILFSNVVKQFVVADIDSVEKISNIFGIDIEEFQNVEISKTIDLISKEKENIEKSIINYIAKTNNSRFSKKKSTQITLNNGTSQNATAYSLYLTSEQTKELYLEVLKDLGEQEIVNKINTDKTLFPETNIVIYLSNNQTIRTTVEIENIQVEIDFYENQLNIKYNDLTENQTKTVSIDITKEEQNTLIDYEDSFNNNINLKYSLNEEASSKNANIQLTFQNDYIKEIELLFNQNLETSDTVIEGIQKKFENQPIVNISELNNNNRNSALYSLIKRIDALLLNENNQINSQIINLWLKINSELENKYQGIKEKQIKDFNNQFLSYNGNDVKKEIIYNLLDLSGRNMEKYEENGEDIYRIYLSEGTKNIKLAEEIKSKIEKSDKQFSVKFGYNSEGKINIVEIRGYEKQ